MTPGRGGARAGLLIGATLIALGVALRLVEIDRSLWHDEAWVANSLLEPRFADTLRYPDWLQTTPPLVLACMRAALALLGPTNVAFRAFPFVAGVAALALFALLARRLLPSGPALVALGVFAVSPHLAWFASSAKQFSSDALASVALLLLAGRACRRRDDASLALALAGFAALCFLSYPALLGLPVLAWAALRTGTSRSGALGRLIATLAVGAAVAGAVHAGFVEPNRDALLDAYWRDAMPTSLAPGALAGYLADRTRSLLAPFFFVPGSRPARLATLALLALGAASLARRALAARRGPDRLREMDRAALLLGLPGALLAANLLALYPVPRTSFGGRVVLFAFPCLALLLGEALRALGAAATRASGGRLPAAALPALAGALLAALFAVQVGRQGLVGTLRVSVAEDGQAAVAALARTARLADTLYVHGSMAEPFKLYARRTPVAAGRIVEGRIGLPCCSRLVAGGVDPGPRTGTLADEVDRLGVDALPGRLLVLLADRPGYWKLVGRDDGAGLRAELEARGCTRAAVTRFPGTRFDTYRCGAPPTAPRPPLARPGPPASFRAP